MVEPVSVTISIVTPSLFGLAGKFREQDEQRRAEVSRYFADIADARADKMQAILQEIEDNCRVQTTFVGIAWHGSPPFRCRRECSDCSPSHRGL